MREDELADLIEAFVNGTSGDWDWDDFISVKQSSPQMEEMRRRCANMPSEFPPTRSGEYCGEEGVARLRSYIEELRKGVSS